MTSDTHIAPLASGTDHSVVGMLQESAWSLWIGSCLVMLGVPPFDLRFYGIIIPMDLLHAWSHRPNVARRPGNAGAPAAGFRR